MRISDWMSDVCSSDLLAQLAGNATLLAVGIAPQGVLATEARAERPFLVRIIDRVFRPEHGLQGQPQAFDQLRQEEAAGRSVEYSHSPFPLISMSLRHPPSAACRRVPDIRPPGPPRRATAAGTLSNRAA